MILNEQQITQREEILLGLIEAIAEDCFEFDDNYEMTNEDAYIASIVMDHFMENYQQPTIREATVMSLMDFDINDELYEEIIDMMLDESVGTFVAGAAHGIRNALSKYSASRASVANKKAKMKSKALAQKYVDYTKSVKKTGIKKGVLGQAKAAFQYSRSVRKGEKAYDADQAHRAPGGTAAKVKSAYGKHGSNVQKTTNLANRIDTGISNVKNKVSGAIMTGAKKFGSALGRLVG